MYSIASRVHFLNPYGEHHEVRWVRLYSLPKPGVDYLYLPSNFRKGFLSKDQFSAYWFTNLFSIYWVKISGTLWRPEIWRWTIQLLFSRSWQDHGLWRDTRWHSIYLLSLCTFCYWIVLSATKSFFTNCNTMTPKVLFLFLSSMQIQWQKVIEIGNNWLTSKL